MTAAAAPWASASLSNPEVLRSAPAIAITGLSTEPASSTLATPSAISSPAGSIQIARGPPNSAIALASSASTAGSVFTVAAGIANFSAPRLFSSRVAKCRDPASSGP